MTNGLKLERSKNLCFSFTDRQNTYLMLNSDDVTVSDGIIRGDDILFYDVCIIADEALYTRFDTNAHITIYHSYYTVDFPNAGLRLKVALLQNALYTEVSSLLEEGGAVFAKGFLMPEKIQIVYLCSPFMDKRCASAQYKIVSKKCSSRIKKIYGEKANYLRYIESKICIFDFDKNITCGESAQLRFNKHCIKTKLFLQQSKLKSSNNIYDKAFRCAQLAGRALVTGKKTRGIWAGLPWFRDNWGRDTFIALPGVLLASGDFLEARKVIEGFANYQDTDINSKTYGRIPNRYIEGVEVIYNTADGSLWFIREVLEYAQYTGDKTFIEKMFPVVQLVLEQDINTRTDEKGFLCHGDADTWMDARYKGREPFSPRGNRAVDIQILWYTALMCGVYMANMLLSQNTKVIENANKWKEAASLLKTNFIKHFWNASTECMADCLMADGTPDFRCRPNQLFLVSLPFSYLEDPAFISSKIADSIVQTCTKKLVFPYGICSLEQSDPYFHPYHDGCSKYHKDAAYHNGTIWGWNAGFTISSLCRCGYSDTAWLLSENLAHQILETGCVGSMSENLNAWPGPNDVKMSCGDFSYPTGTWSQAWSVSEFVRNTFQDYLGIEPQLLENTINICPHIPSDWLKKGGMAFIPLGMEDDANAALKKVSKVSGIHYKWSIKDNKTSIKITSQMNMSVQINMIFKDETQTIKLVPTNTHTFVGICIGAVVNDSLTYKKIDFAQPDIDIDPPALEQKNYLRTIITQGTFNDEHAPSPSSVH
ncbi:MAG TPA: amylo-alpha-1,6-glucosidase [Treponemataceae bacterium]|nr:amylo-alpha-1,6-glucosidase [Treponemataceae bacterium]